MTRKNQRCHLAVTESINTNARNLDTKTVAAIINLMHKENQIAAKAVYAARRNIALLIKVATKALRNHGRVFYVGAGTSGRLGVLDAAECAPTFGVSTKLVQGIIAGGNVALKKAVENSEDDAKAGKRSIIKHKISVNDIVIGISASAAATFVKAALLSAKQQGATTWLITCNNQFASTSTNKHNKNKIIQELSLDGVVFLNTGPEIIAGSTRLKAGTATKMALNMVSTIAMIQIGAIYDSIMVSVKPTNNKLRARAIRIVSSIAKCSSKKASQLLKQAANQPKVAIVMHLHNLTKIQAEKLLKKHDGCLRSALA